LIKEIRKLENSFKWIIAWFGIFLMQSQVIRAQETESDTIPLSSVQSILEKDFEDSFRDVAAGIQYNRSFVDRKLKERGQKITAFGYYRLFLYGRNMQEPYPGLEPFDKAFGVGDGYREPMLSFNVLARPNSKSSFGTELFFFTPYDGSIEGNVFSTNLGLNFYGNFRTQHGNFGVRAGGIHWYNLTPFTIGVFQILDRFSIYDRTPWEGVTNTTKYEDFYALGENNVGDLRWNNQAFQGIILNGAKLPGDIGFDLFWGKTQFNGGLMGATTDLYPNPTLDWGNIPTYEGFAGVDRSLPNYINGGRLTKSFGPKNQTLSYNAIFSRTSVDSLKTDQYRSFQVHTLSLDLNFNDVKVSGELGAGNYKSPTYSEKWGEALMLRFMIPEKYTYIPIDIQVYQISRNFYNPNSEIQSNSNLDILADAGLSLGATGAGGQLTVVNQLVHNRRGINLNTNINIGDVKLAGGWGISSEIEAEAPILSFNHRINGLAMSRIYNPFPAGATGPTIFGPYNRKFSFFRGQSEFVQTTDIDPENGLALNRKYFQAIDLSGKYQTMLFDRSLHFFYLASFGAISSNQQAIPLYNDNSYLFVQYHEFDLYYELFPKFIFAGYFGVEAARGGAFTEWNEETNLPLDQLGTAIGIGFDWQVAPNSGIYVRHRWMEFEDRSFPLDRYRGTELTVELKTYF
jgi:hypothetical protein